jgi:hypothetical protein
LDVSWESHFLSQKSNLPPCILRYIENLALLHKSEEAIIDQLRLHAQSTDEDRDEDGNEPRIPFDVDLGNDDDDIWDLDGNHSTATLAVIQSALEGSLESTDLYVDEAMEANFANGYFELTPDILPSLFGGQIAGRQGV